MADERTRDDEYTLTALLFKAEALGKHACNYLRQAKLPGIRLNPWERDIAVGQARGAATFGRLYLDLLERTQDNTNRHTCTLKAPHSSVIATDVPCIGCLIEKERAGILDHADTFKMFTRRSNTIETLYAAAIENERMRPPDPIHIVTQGDPVIRCSRCNGAVVWKRTVEGFEVIHGPCA
jgi:hypothetical protein